MDPLLETSASALESVDAPSDYVTWEQWVYVEMPSGNSKFAFLQRDSIVKLGKFGSFQTNDVFGKPFGLPYEIVDGDRVRFAGRATLFDDFQVDDDPDGSNKYIFDSRDIQKLSITDIEKLKDEKRAGKITAEARSLIQHVAENNSAFEKKTEFSKAKYLRRKEQKFGRIFRLFRPTAAIVCKYFLEVNAFKICDVRMDTLSQILLFGNVRFGARVLVVDEVAGLLVGAVMERLGGAGTVLAIHDSEENKFDCLPYLNWGRSEQDRLQTLPWGRVMKGEDEAYSDLRSNAGFVNVQLTETFTREYQAKPGRFHPLMNMSGNGGYLITALRVLPFQTDQPMVEQQADSENMSQRKRVRMETA
ncbi:tRNA (adenine(58)-N(1))-methyltransferase non-catalytic subunit trm6 [Gonapodya sp. JEL0774]|nr:tRNA (adenine(58)-N(1))-methyltransferase non-catalytic subunit trm6 [Gonapodya sp. JEL0774]